MNSEKQQDPNLRLQINLLKTFCQRAMMKCQEEQINEHYYHAGKKKVIYRHPQERKILYPQQQPQSSRLNTECSVKVRPIVVIKKNNYCWNSQDNINEKNKQLSNVSLKALGDDQQFKQQPRFHIPKLSLGNEKQLKIVQLNKQLQSLTSRQSSRRQRSTHDVQLKMVNNESLNALRQRQLDQMFSAQKGMVKYLMHQHEHFNDTLLRLEKSINNQ